jgi:hypothetical protein
MAQEAMRRRLVEQRGCYTFEKDELLPNENQTLTSDV